MKSSAHKIRLSGKVPAGNILIDGSGVGDVGNIVLRDRRLLSQDGILIVVVTLHRQDKSIAAGPEIISRGFVYVRESEKLMEEATCYCSMKSLRKTDHASLLIGQH